MVAACVLSQRPSVLPVESDLTLGAQGSISKRGQTRRRNRDSCGINAVGQIDSGSRDRCTTSDAKTGGSNRVPGSDYLQAFGFEWFRERDLRRLATNIIWNFGASEREASVAAAHPLSPASLFECGSSSISQMSPQVF